MSDFLINNFPNIFTNFNLEFLQFSSMMMFLVSIFVLLPCGIWIFNSFYYVFTKYRFF